MIHTDTPVNNNPADWQAFGSKLRAKRMDRGITLRAFSVHIGYSPTIVSYVEQGALRGNDSVALAMCVHLDVPFSEYESLMKPMLAYDRCSCGRLMSLILGVEWNNPDGVQVFWCAGCGEANVHYNDRSGDSRYTPRPELKGKA